MTTKTKVVTEEQKKLDEMLDRIEKYEPKNKPLGLINELANSDIQGNLSEENDDKQKHPGGRDIIYVITKKKRRGK